MPNRIPVIDCTDLYHPHQDPGDNFDILTPYALPEVELLAVVLDTTERLRRPPQERTDVDPNLFHQDPGNRDPGFLSILQCNYLFDRDVPAAVSPFRPLRSPEDRAEDVPGFQQRGIELLLKTLREAPEPVDIVVFCSCRTVAAAWNRDPDLMRQKVRRLHLSLGCSTGEPFDWDWEANRGVTLAPGKPHFLEWNVALDPHAVVQVLRSGLPLALYPCASENGPFFLGRHNTYYRMSSLSWILDMDPRLRNYLGYAFCKSSRPDFLRALEGELPPDQEHFFRTFDKHNVWETAVWLEVTGRQLVRRADGSARIVVPADVLTTDRLVSGGLRPCRLLAVHDDGRFQFELCDDAGLVSVFDRGDSGAEYEAAAAEALAALYLTFRSTR